ncbi:alpha/beta fold hydrolase [Cesiribacter sp. SM1]|uniref:alpha/beta fold hydrolase n=1 Tax=Cesiribacter sp. SM1 TaxID=2861196 RepID=UPI001CD73A08|nr:alpha/beta hydrolase [Cesiribacter sp. SM1]
MAFEIQYYQLNGIKLHVVEAGPADGEVLLFLHGFPEFFWGWRHQIDFFAKLGYRVIAPNQRGYHLSSKPAGKKAYRMKQLTSDIAELIRLLPHQKVNLVGHDWGGAVAWSVAIHYPQLLQKLIVLNLPHPQVMRNFLKSRPKQWLKSSYVGFFQIPFLPEKLLSMRNYRLLERSMIRTSKPGTFSSDDMLRYKQAWRQRGALTAMINWYRAALSGTLKKNQKIQLPTLLIWGKQDQFLSHEMAQPSIEMCESGRLEMIPDATHWVQHEKAELVNRLILEFISDCKSND